MLGEEYKKFLEKTKRDIEYLPNFSSWSQSRKDIALEQTFYKSVGINVGAIDGLIGPQTRYAREVYSERQKGNNLVSTWRDNRERWPLQKNISEFFGIMGENQVSCNVPFDLIIPWDKSNMIRQYSCHKLVKEPMERVWKRTLEYYGEKTINELRLNYFGGCLNVRKMRGGSAWSTHSWGIAIDIDPDRNELRTTWANSQMSKKEYEKFVEFWYDEGAINLGKEANYDSMHFQFCRLR